MVLHIAIVENDAEPVEEEKTFFERYQKEKNIETEITVFISGYDFLEANPERFDLIFMDIDMPGINGMETSERYRQRGGKGEIVFVTNLPQFAIDGYRVSALDFLLKPLTYEDFYLTMERFMKKSVKEDYGNLTISYRGTISQYRIGEISYLEMVGHNIEIHFTNGGKTSFRLTMRALEKGLKSPALYRCNNGIVVNLYEVKSYDNETLTMKSGARLSVSRSHKKEMMQKLTQVFANTLITGE